MVAGLLLFGTTTAAAQEDGRPPAQAAAASRDAVPAGKTDPAEILARAKQAAGGDGWDGVCALHLRGQSTAGGLSGSAEEWTDVLTGRNAARFARPPSAGASGFDGVSAWTQDAAGYSYVLGDEDARQGAVNEAYRRSLAFWFPGRGNATLASAPQQKDGGSTYDVVNITPQGGRPFSVWVDRTTHLIDRFVEQQGEDVQVIRWLDYREVAGGIKLPFTVRLGDGEERWDEVNTVEAVEVNAPLAPDQFALPAVPAPDFTFQNGASATTAPFRLVDGKLLVDIKLNGQGPFAAEVDSGGNYIVQPALAQRLGLRSQGASQNGGGGEGFVAAGRTLVDTVEIGGVRLTKQSYKVRAFREKQPELTLLGLQVFERFVVGINFDERTLTLTRPEAFEYHGNGRVVPFHFQDNQPEMNGSIDGVAGVFTIDTGDDGALLLIAPFTKRYGLVERYKATIPYAGRAGGGATYGLMTRTGALHLFGADGRPAVEAHDLLTRLSQQKSGFDADRYVSGNVGIDILRQFNLIFDYRSRQIIFEPNRDYGLRVPFNRTGLRLKADGAAWEVLSVAASSPAAELGVKPGDRVLSINGLDATRLTRGEQDALFTQEVGSKIVLALLAGTEARTVTLSLRDVL